jgi:hypothetical protein
MKKELPLTKQLRENSEKKIREAITEQDAINAIKKMTLTEMIQLRNSLELVEEHFGLTGRAKYFLEILRLEIMDKER